MMTVLNSDLEILANYESSRLIRTRYKKLHGGDASGGKAREIATAFVQARGYLKSAEAADRIVRPLLVYYAVLSFSRALTMFLTPDLRESGLAKSHGLSVEGWSEELNKDEGDIANIRIRLNSKGTLCQLLYATKYQSLLRNNISIPNHLTVDKVPPVGAEITLGDVLSRFPEIRATYRRWRPDRHSVGFWPEASNQIGVQQVRVLSPYNKDDLVAVFGENFTPTETNGVISFIPPPSVKDHILSDSVGAWGVGNFVALSLYPGDIELSKIATAFIVSYALGMLARYYPSHWVGILNNYRYDEAMPSLLAALQQIETGFPKLIVDFLERFPPGF